MTNLLLSMLDKVGVPADTLGDSTGRLDIQNRFRICSAGESLVSARASPDLRCAVLAARRGRRSARRPPSCSIAARQEPATRSGRARCSSKHADVNAAEADGTTALHWAVHRDDLETVDLLLAAGANRGRPTRYGVTPLHLAATNGNAAIVERLLKAGADANAALPRGRDAADDGRALGQRGSGEAAAGARRRRQRERRSGRDRRR